MKKCISLMALLVVCICFPVFATETTVEHEVTNDTILFRGFEWGAPLEEIQKEEITDEMVYYDDYYTNEETKEFTVKTTIGSRDMLATFAFDDDWKLIAGAYSVNITRISQVDSYADFYVLDSGLKTVYGDATLEYTYGFSDFSSESTEQIVHDLLENGALIMNEWLAFDGSCVASLCSAIDGSINTGIYYFSDYNKLIEIIQEVTDTEGL